MDKEEGKLEAKDLLESLNETTPEEIVEETQPGIGYIQVPQSKKKKPGNRYAESAYTKRWQDTKRTKRKKRKQSAKSRKKNRRKKKK